MLIVSILPAVFAAVGVLLYLLSKRADVKEVGRIMFFCGLLVFLFAMIGKTVSVDF